LTGLTAVLPCYNEGAQVDRAYLAIIDALGEIEDLELLIVDDGSTDDTLDHIRALAAADPRVKYLSFSRNFGLEAAHAAGFAYAGQPWSVQLDADLQSPPDQTWLLLAKAEEGYDVVFGVRENRQDPLVRRLGSSGQRWFARRFLGIETPPGASTFRVIRTAVARRLVDLRLGAPYFIAMVPMIGARYACVPTRHRQRAGRSKWRMSRLVGHSFELFFGYSWRPLNAVYVLAVLGAAAGALGLLAAAASGAATGTALAVCALIASVLTLSAVALSTRYLHRLLLDSRHTRPYYIREANVPVRPEDGVDGGAPLVEPPSRRSTAGVRS
jgi:glycosyltransferase involved in cell wall biosynthesis